MSRVDIFRHTSTFLVQANEIAGYLLPATNRFSNQIAPKTMTMYMQKYISAITSHVSTGVKVRVMMNWPRKVSSEMPMTERSDVAF